jgi:hypothetical protein
MVRESGLDAAEARPKESEHVAAARPRAGVARRSMGKLLQGGEVEIAVG